MLNMHNALAEYTVHTIKGQSFQEHLSKNCFSMNLVVFSNKILDLFFNKQTQTLNLSLR